MKGRKNKKSKKVEQLKEVYPRLWEKACKEFSATKAREKYFLALVEIKKARVEERVEKEKERKRRTRALILFASNVIRKCSSEELKELIELVQDEMRAREGKTELDYLPFLISEIKQYHPEFEFETEENEIEEPEEEAVAEEAVPSVREEVKRKLETEFEKVVEKVFEED